MKRLHVHIQTENMEKSVSYYTALFGAAPEKQREDYARWLLDDPFAHVSVSSHGGQSGIDHVGISIDSEAELEAYAERLAKADAIVRPEPGTTCCYATSNKHWSTGPDGETWELFHTYGESDSYGEEPSSPAGSPTATSSCCG
ncbi:MAG: glyoxalase/bleomycin resistance/dioxygenase family protein [Alphaproteobacteria bacterium]|nr:glyoxalase/bleomycin resistance/dioxygenase family protein [Alphaproteobacteria bacterium]